MEKEKISKIFLLLTCFYITLILISNILAGRLISIAGLSFTGAVIIFPFTYILSDIFTEIYGFHQNKKVIWLSFACNLMMVIIFMLVLQLPYPETFENQGAYQQVLGTTPRMLVASLAGFLFGNFLNSMILSKLKVVTKGKYLAFRTISSTVVGEAIDTLIFITIAFLGTLTNQAIIMMVINQSIFKILIEVLFTPMMYFIIKSVKKAENIDVYDQNMKYSIFK